MVEGGRERERGGGEGTKEKCACYTIHLLPAQVDLLCTLQYLTKEFSRLPIIVKDTNSFSIIITLNKQVLMMDRKSHKLIFEKIVVKGILSVLRTH